MKRVNILFPNQLFQESPLFDNKDPWYVVEEFLFFKQYPFHKQKIAFHRATMKRYADFLQKEKNLEVHYVESCLLYTSPSPRDATLSRMPSSA